MGSLLPEEKGPMEAASFANRLASSREKKRNISTRLHNNKVTRNKEEFNSSALLTMIEPHRCFFSSRVMFCGISRPIKNFSSGSSTSCLTKNVAS